MLDRKRISGAEKRVRYRNPEEGQYVNKIIRGDCLDVMPQMIKNGLKGKITNIICSPPYNCNKNYGKKHDDDMPYGEYLEWMGKVIGISSKLLRPGGRLIWVVAEVVQKRKYSDTDSYCHTIYPDIVHMVRRKNYGLKLRECIIWNKTNTNVRNLAIGSFKSPSSPILRSKHEYIIVWSKDQWNLPNITGEEPDITKKEFLDWTFSVWSISPKSNNKINHPATFPETLVERLIKLYSYPGDLICDPFNGSGTTTAVASSLNRRWLGIDLNPRYCSYALKRTNTATVLGDNNKFLTTQLITYIGNKRKLLDLIAEGIGIVKERLSRDKLIILDGFSGSGVVSRALKKHSSILHSNDIEYYSEILNRCYLSNPSEIDIEEIKETIKLLNNKCETNSFRKGFIEFLYSPKKDGNIRRGEKVFYTNQNAIIIDNTRRMISDIEKEKQHFYIAPLLVEASIHANTAGVFKGFYKNSNTGMGQFGGNYEDCLDRIMSSIVLPVPIFGKYECDIKIWTENANANFHLKCNNDKCQNN